MRKLMLIVLAGLLLMPAVATAAQEATPSSPAGGDDAAMAADGPITVVGQAGSANALAGANLFPEPSVVLLDVSTMLTGEIDEFVSEDGQIMGRMTTPLFPMPGSYRVDLPIQPKAEAIDLDFDGADDAGVQIFALLVSSNLTGDSYLQQLEQLGAFTSYLTDPQTGRVTEGSFLLYAADDAQAFPSGFGDDGLWLTEDDPSAPLAAGYTVARLGADGTVTLDRSPEVTMDTLEAPEQASADFSDQGILESYTSLIDLLIERYAYTELRGLDWEQIRAEFLPAVQEADANQDFAAYFHVLRDLATSLRDAHVAASTFNLDILTAGDPLLESIQGNVGATVIAVTNPAAPDQPPGDTIVVLTVGADSPAAAAGWVPGTEIVSVDGKSVAERYQELPLFYSVGTEETARAQQTGFFLKFPAGQQVTIEFKQPGAEGVQSVTMEAGEFDTGETFTAPNADALPISLHNAGGHTIVRWTDFVGDVQTKIAVLEEALSAQMGGGDTGIIFDLRGNAGGWEELYEVMASYFFTADDPMPLHFLDWYHYDAESGGLVLDYAPDLELSAPKPELAYAGPLVILVDASCVSACEYFTQTLQKLGRATVVGQYGTMGGGGNIDVVQMPGDIKVQFTVGRSTFAGTDEFNIEAKGVTPDVRVPVTLETEQAKAVGGDPVLDAGIEVIDAAVEEISATQVAEIYATMTAEAMEATATTGTPVPSS